MYRNKKQRKDNRTKIKKIKNTERFAIHFQKQNYLYHFLLNFHDWKILPV